jgi:ferric-dicitrate binding protein FerR (iron transport regulator)
MDSNRENENEKNSVDNICTEVLHILNALKYPDLSRQMEERKPYIFERINCKIDRDKAGCSIKKSKRSLYGKYLGVACIVLSFLPVAAVSYYMGYAMEKEMSAQAQVDIDVPYGIVSRITLPDGSLVVLNGGSRLSYPAAFDKNRQMYLSGEGFFEIIKDEKHPCTVDTRNISVKVLGTRFSFKAYEEDEQTVLTLEEGSLSAIPVYKNKKECILLNPDQQLILNHQTGDLRRKTVQANDYTGWKDGRLSFINMSLGEIATVLERRFDIKIMFHSDSIRDEHYYAQFENDENLDQILALLSHKRSWTYVRKNNVINVVENR